MNSNEEYKNGQIIHNKDLATDPIQESEVDAKIMELVYNFRKDLDNRTCDIIRYVDKKFDKLKNIGIGVLLVLLGILIGFGLSYIRRI